DKCAKDRKQGAEAEGHRDVPIWRSTICCSGGAGRRQLRERDVQEACAFDSYTLPKLYVKMHVTVLHFCRLGILCGVEVRRAAKARLPPAGEARNTKVLTLL
uniref:Uncharacterized protein n=1 Tax=Anas platyrhynchos platyrhynchos TaxID=8840 RepID=A0A493SY78_ANAPP